MEIRAGWYVRSEEPGREFEWDGEWWTGASATDNDSDSTDLLTPPADWYVDADDAQAQAYFWDGTAFTEQTVRSAVSWGLPPADPKRRPPSTAQEGVFKGEVPTNVSPPPGWYLDPLGGRLNRWWDGTLWTEHSAPIPPPSAVQPQNAGKSMPTAYLFAILLGGFGVHRFYLGRPISASILLTIAILAVITGAMSDSGTSPLLAVVWIWTIVDLFLIPGMVRSTRSK